MDRREFYKSTTLRILGQFQLMEFALKHYIGFSYQLIHKQLDGVAPFDYTIKDVENHPLEKLLAIFAKLNDNTELQEKLNKLRSKRNHVAHRSLLVSMGTRDDNEALEKASEEFFYLEDEVVECVQALLDELRHVKSKLYGQAA